MFSAECHADACLKVTVGGAATLATRHQASCLVGCCRVVGSDWPPRLSESAEQTSKQSG